MEHFSTELCVFFDARDQSDGSEWRMLPAYIFLVIFIYDWKGCWKSGRKRGQSNKSCSAVATRDGVSLQIGGDMEDTWAATNCGWNFGPLVIFCILWSTFFSLRNRLLQLRRSYEKYVKIMNIFNFLFNKLFYFSVSLFFYRIFYFMVLKIYIPEWKKCSFR